MGIRSDFCCYFQFKIDKSQEFKEVLTAYILKVIDHDDNIFNNFYQIDSNSMPKGYIGFCLMEECIKFEYILPNITLLLNLFDEIKNDGYDLSYEAQELCTEFINTNDNDYNRRSNDDINNLYVSCHLDGIPEMNEITLINWLNS